MHVQKFGHTPHTTADHSAPAQFSGAHTPLRFGIASDKLEAVRSAPKGQKSKAAKALTKELTNAPVSLLVRPWAYLTDIFHPIQTGKTIIKNTVAAYQAAAPDKDKSRIGEALWIAGHWGLCSITLGGWLVLSMIFPRLAVGDTMEALFAAPYHAYNDRKHAAKTKAATPATSH